MRIATWNVNSVKQRLDHVLAFLKDAEPDVLCLQEIKCVDEAFPREAIESAGYNVAIHGQKAFNGVVRVASIYLPNGNPLGTPKFDYKLAWMDRLKAHARDLLASEEPLVLAGDYNVIPEPRDARRPEVWVNDALFRPESRAKFRELLRSEERR